MNYTRLTTHLFRHPRVTTTLLFLLIALALQGSAAAELEAGMSGCLEGDSGP